MHMLRGYYDPEMDIFYGHHPDTLYEAEVPPVGSPGSDDFLGGRVRKGDLIPVKLTMDPEKKAAFHDFLACCRKDLEFSGGRIEVTKGVDPRNMVIHIYAHDLVFSNIFGYSTLRDLGRIAQGFTVRATEDGIHAQIMIPVYVVEYETENGENGEG